MSPEPSAQDRENARRRAAISARQNAEYAEALKLALTLGPDYKPWMKLCLIDSDHRNTGNTEPFATVFKVYRGERRLSENSVDLRRMPDGQVLMADGYEPLFGDLLHEEHPTKRLEIRGQMIPAPKWSLCWASLERYEPLDASQLAALRVSRERGKARREEAKFQRENPLLAWAVRENREVKARQRQ